jgi:NADH-quinone oxidoreductase subunit E
MSRLNDANVAIAHEIIARYPRPKSALIPLVHLSQEQNGYVTQEAMKHVAELVGVTPAEVLGTASFYEMFKFEPVGKYVMHRAEHRLGIKPGGTTADGMFTLEHAECQAACTEAPCLQVNYRYRFRMTPDQLDTLIDDLAAGKLAEEIPPHGTLAKVRQHIPADRAVGAVRPEDVNEAPVWMDGKAAL